MPEIQLYRVNGLAVAELRRHRAVLRLAPARPTDQGLVADNPPLLMHLSRSEALPALDALTAEIARVRAELVAGMGL